MKRVDLAGGAAVPICDIPAGSGKAGTWGRSDILFTSIQGGTLYRVPASGGQPVIVIRSDANTAQALAWPWFLPDGERFLYSLRDRDGQGNLMLVEPGKAPRSVGHIASFFQYVDPGFLVYSREGTLVAQRFDWKSGRISGEPVSVAERVRYFYSTASAGFRGARRDDRVSLAAGRRAASPGSIAAAGRWPRSVRRGSTSTSALTADGKRLFFDRTRPGAETYHVWSYDLERGVETPVTNGIDTEAFPRLLADGKSLIYSAVRARRRCCAAGTSRPERMRP